VDRQTAELPYHIPRDAMQG